MHHGIKGMKWGVRKQRVASSVKSGAKTFGRKAKLASQFKTEAGEAERKQKAKLLQTQKQKNKEKLAQMSDAELRQAIKRLELERQYNYLNTPAVKMGKNDTERLMTKIGEQAITTVANETVKFGMKLVTDAIKDKLES